MQASVIDGTTDKVIATIDVGSPQDVAFNPDNRDIYLTASTNSYHSLFIIDVSTNKVIETIPVGTLTGYL